MTWDHFLHILTVPLFAVAFVLRLFTTNTSNVLQNKILKHTKFISSSSFEIYIIHFYKNLKIKFKNEGFINEFNLKIDIP